MNEKQYNNIVFTSLSNIRAESTEQSNFEKVKLVLKNMGVPLPNGDPQIAIDILATDDYMGWAACDYQEAKEFVNSGIPTIAVKDTEISIVSADISDEDVAMVSNSTSVISADALIEEQSTATSYYAYSRATTTKTSYYLSPMSGYQSVSVGWTERFKVKKTPGGTEVSDIKWTTSDSAVATVDANGNVTTKKPGIATIRAKSNSNSKIDFSCELWVQGKRPVFLIHGRVSNSLPTWGAINKIYGDPVDDEEHDNNHYNQAITAFSDGNPAAQYVDKETQDICNYKEPIAITVCDSVDGGNATFYSNYNIGGIFNGKFVSPTLDTGNRPIYYRTHPEGGNLAYYLESMGYKRNVNLFVFNYPNEDAVIHSAEKFRSYIYNLTTYVKDNGTNEMKCCFYSSRYKYESDKYQINIVGHSMGGLVARFYIEDLERDEYVDKLITIDTPHWGSEYADDSNSTGLAHKLCDHDLAPNSRMYGGSNQAILYNGCNHCDCDSVDNNNYVLTPELQYSRSRNTEYYAIAGVSKKISQINDNNFAFEIPPYYTTYQQIKDLLKQKHNGLGNITIEDADDGVVKFLSQIGWSSDNADSPEKRIRMAGIYVNFDTNGGYYALPYLELVNSFHSDMPHRQCVLEKVYSYLQL